MEERRYYGVYFSDGGYNSYLFDVVFSEEEAVALMDKYEEDDELAPDEWYEVCEISAKRAEAFFAER